MLNKFIEGTVYPPSNTGLLYLPISTSYLGKSVSFLIMKKINVQVCCQHCNIKKNQKHSSALNLGFEFQ